MGSWEEKVGQPLMLFLDPGFLLPIYSMYGKFCLGANRRPEVASAGRALCMAERSGR